MKSGIDYVGQEATQLFNDFAVDLTPEERKRLAQRLISSNEVELADKLGGGFPIALMNVLLEDTYPKLYSAFLVNDGM